MRRCDAPAQGHRRKYTSASWWSETTALPGCAKALRCCSTSESTPKPSSSESIHNYLTGVPADVAVLLSHFRVTDVALRVVGVGSVGTRCYLAILTGPDGTPLVLQIKEANRSVLEEYGGAEQPPPANLRPPPQKWLTAEGW